jgi:hypothetical protein
MYRRGGGLAGAGASAPEKFRGGQAEVAEATLLFTCWAE